LNILASAVIPEIFHRESRDFKNDYSVNLSPLEKDPRHLPPLEKGATQNLPLSQRGIEGNF
jgi:hypothetical protein